MMAAHPTLAILALSVLLIVVPKRSVAAAPVVPGLTVATQLSEARRCFVRCVRYKRTIIGRRSCIAVQRICLGRRR
jgi:hypothetical protein